MFMEIAIGAIGIGIVLMLGYIVLAQVRAALPSAPQASYTNACAGYYLNDTTHCNTTAVTCGPIADNSSGYISCGNVGYTTGLASVQATAFAGFGLIAVGIIVLAAFGLINIFK